MKHFITFYCIVTTSVMLGFKLLCVSVCVLVAHNTLEINLLLSLYIVHWSLSSKNFDSIFYYRCSIMTKCMATQAKSSINSFSLWAFRLCGAFGDFNLKVSSNKAIVLTIPTSEDLFDLFFFFLLHCVAHYMHWLNVDYRWVRRNGTNINVN